MNKIFEKQYLIRTSVLFASMFFSLWFSLVQPSYLMSLIFCVIEFNAILLYFCNTFPLGQGTVRQVREQAATAAIKQSVRSFF